MRVLFVPMATPPHYWPMVPVAWACRAAGHEVRVAGQPALIDAIRQSGMTPVRVGADYDIMRHMAELKVKLGKEIQQHQSESQAAGGAPGFPPSFQRRVQELKFGPQAELAVAVAEDLVSLARSWRPHIIVSDALFHYVAPLCAAAGGARLVRHLWGPDFSSHLGFFPGIGASGLGSDRSHWPDSLLQLFDRFGVDVRADFYDMVLDPGPASLQVPGLPHALSYGCMPFNGPGELPRWLLEPPSAPRICVTQGSSITSVMGDAGFIVPEIISGLADLDAEIVVAVKPEDRKLITAQPANVRIAEWLPLNLVLPTCSAIIHQGGGGTTLTSAYCGVPQVIVPQMLDERFNAERYASCGAAVALDPAQIPEPGQFGDVVARTVRELLADGNDAARAARDLQKEIASQPTPAELVAELAGLVA